ncbi:phage baseplate assembly protein V [Longispora albida]|uniref:phage baseplate assembly protein V n=1 Tax=Longispora albida TaxID=203523 RepID=UPI00037F5122|nr:phage baseplate assembly protein V [Longispora albida]
MHTLPDGSAPGYFGVYPALVTTIADPEYQGKVEVSFPWLGTDGNREVRAWATLCSPYADNNQGFQVVPEVGSQVVVAFEAGNLRRPYIIGCAWNGKAKEAAEHQKPNNIRVWRSRADSRLEFDDGPAPKVSVTMKSGHRVVMDDGAQEILVEHASGAQVKLTVSTVEVKSNMVVKVNAILVNVDAPISTFNGNVICKTLMAEAFVISPAYTPGLGNLL